MNSQLANLQVSVLVGASICLTPGIDRESVSPNPSQSIDLEDPNMASVEGFLFSMIDVEAMESANVVETKSDNSDKAELEIIFNGLVKNWIEATRSYSLNIRRFAHPTYQILMHALGKENVNEVVPLLLHELQQRPDVWFDALEVLTNAKPAKEAKTFEDAVNAWLEWGRREKYI